MQTNQPPHKSWSHPVTHNSNQSDTFKQPTTTTTTTTTTDMSSSSSPNVVAPTTTEVEAPIRASSIVTIEDASMPQLVVAPSSVLASEAIAAAAAAADATPPTTAAATGVKSRVKKPATRKPVDQCHRRGSVSDRKYTVAMSITIPGVVHRQTTHNGVRVIDYGTGVAYANAADVLREYRATEKSRPAAFNVFSEYFTPAQKVISTSNGSHLVLTDAGVLRFWMSNEKAYTVHTADIRLLIAHMHQQAATPFVQTPNEVERRKRRLDNTTDHEEHQSKRLKASASTEPSQLGVISAVAELAAPIALVA